MTISVRAATPDDVRVVGELYVELRNHHARLDPEALRYRTDDDVWMEWARGLLDDAGQHIRLALEDHDVVGLTCLEFVRKPWGIACEIHTLIVREGARGKGVGEALLRDAEGRACSEGARGMRVDVLSANDEGRRFYEERGFKTSAVRYALDF